MCNRVGKLYFRLAGIEDRGVWCYATKSRGIEYIEKYLNLMKEKGINITENYFLLSLNEKNGQSGKVYVPDIKLIKEEKKQEQSNKSKEQKKASNSQSSNCYKYIRGKMIDYDGNKIPELFFAKDGEKEKALYLTKESNKAILKLKPGTTISITKINRNKDNMFILKDYKIIKAVEQQNNLLEKKAV